MEENAMTCIVEEKVPLRLFPTQTGVHHFFSTFSEISCRSGTQLLNIQAQFRQLYKFW